MARVYLGIGSNLGDREGNCLEALARMPGMGIVVTKRSSLYETEPWGVTDQPMFLNMAVEAETEAPPKELLERLQEIERSLGRQESVKWGPRVIDLDILMYGSLIANEERLVVPHPLLHERDFVLDPLAEIAGDVVHPVLKKTVRALREERRADDGKHQK